MSDEKSTDTLREKVLEKLRDSKRPRATVARLSKASGIGERKLHPILRELSDSGEVVLLPANRVALAERSGLITGTVKAGRRGGGVVIPDVADAPLRLGRNAIRPAMDGDRVLVEAEPYARRGLREATIRKILNRGRTSVVAAASMSDPHRLLPLDGRLEAYVIVLSDDSRVPAPGEAVVAEIVEYPSQVHDLIVRVERTLGEVGRLTTEILSVCHGRGVIEEFPDAAEAEAAAFGDPGEQDTTGRADMRNKPLFTIDPADARDHDDAVCIHRIDEDHWSVTVAIADVAHYVQRGTALDAEAEDRATSIYFPGRVVPMLPHALSSGLASLHEGEDRLAMTVTMTIGSDGTVEETGCAPALIRCRAALSYEQAQQVLEHDGGVQLLPVSKTPAAEEEAPPTDGVSAEVREQLPEMAACAGALLRARLSRGALDLDLPEAHVVMDDQGEPVTVLRRPRLAAHRVVEEMMLAANETIARKLQAARVAFPYRVHDRPEDDDVRKLAGRLHTLGIRMPGDGNRNHPEAYQKVLEQASDTPVERQVNMMCLRSLQRAVYSAEHGVHFGLASTAYTHFTSPIRRYPDLLVHRAVKAVLEGRQDELPGAPQLRELARHCSERERRATELERDIRRAAAVVILAGHIGEPFHGTVSGVERYGCYVELDDPFVEGFVPVARLYDYFEFIAERMVLQSRTGEAEIRIGDEVQVRIAAVDLTARRVELEPYS